MKQKKDAFCLFVFRPTRVFFSHMETSPLPVKDCKFLPMLGAVIVLSVPQLLWHGASVYNGHLRGPMTLTSIAERLTVELLLSVLTNYVGRGWEKCWNFKKCLVMYKKILVSYNNHSRCCTKCISKDNDDTIFESLW